MIATAVMTILLLAALAAIRTGQDTHRRGTAVLEAQMLARQALDDVSYELLSSSITTLSPPTPKDSPYLRFQKNIGFSGGAIVWSDPYQIEIVSTPRLRKLIMWEDKVPYGSAPGLEDPKPLVLATTLMTDGLSFTLSGSRLTIEVGIVKEIAGQAPVEARCSTTVALRN
jgi:hypothetical protein